MANPAVPLRGGRRTVGDREVPRAVAPRGRGRRQGEADPGRPVRRTWRQLTLAAT
jgi:hypothetical protein